MIGPLARLASRQTPFRDTLAVPVPERAVCAERIRLMNVWSKAAGVYHATVRELTKRAGSLDAKAYDQLLVNADLARQEVEKNRDALDVHRAEHGC